VASQRIRRLQALLLIAVGLMVALVALEIGSRLSAGTLLSLRQPVGDDYHVVDPVVGHIPRAGVAITHPSKGFRIDIGVHGTRSNGNPRPAAARPVTLVVGDSFAFGDEVDDEDTWPAALERRLGAPVINAGVPGFGLDQALLRAEQLAAIYEPDVIVVGFIPHDVLRCQMSYWSGNAKPYFDVDGTGGVRLHPAPVPPPPWWKPLAPLLAMSATVQMLLPTLLDWEGPYQVDVHDRARQVACALMGRLAALARERGAQVVVVAHPQQPGSPPDHVELTAGVLQCARAHGLTALDLFPAFAALPPDQEATLFHGHLSPQGNELVAAELAAVLAPPARPPS
jgi:lysophospholipase L1-like esterase